MKTILIAEDDAIVGNLYMNILEAAGFNVQLVSNGFSLLERFEELEPDAVLVDVMMPGLGGVEAIRELRSSAAGRSVPIIAITSSFVPQFIKETKSAGANTILSKMEVNPKTLVQTLKLFMLSGSEEREAA